jgi:hypothetical protein
MPDDEIDAYESPIEPHYEGLIELHISWSILDKITHTYCSISLNSLKTLI